jgi:hypothetical protein
MDSRSFQTWGYAMVRQRQHAKTSIRVAQLLGYAACALALLAQGCMYGKTRKASSLKSTKNVQSSAPELSSRNQSMLALYSAEIEVAADRIISQSSSPAAQRQALVWKAEAIPVMQASLLNTDPVAAVLDTWAFIFQMTAYMERPALKQNLGESYPVVAETLKNMDAQMEQVVRLGAPTANVADLRQRVRAWAEAHPIQASLAGRQSVDPDVIRKAGQSDLGVTTSIKTLAEAMGDFTARMDSYNLYLPKQARWQAELLLTDFTHDPQISTAMSNFAALSESAAKASGNIDQLPALVDQTRKAFEADVDGERLSAQAFVREERLSTLIDLQQERIATVDALHSERLATTAQIREEREAALKELRVQEIAVMNEFKAFSEKKIQDLDTRGRSLINYFFLRALELMLLTLVLCSLLVWIVLRRFVGGPRGHSASPLNQ